MIRLNNICKKFDECEVFHNFSYEFPETGLFLLYGVSGCGKSTLINIIAGIVKVDSGEVHRPTEDCFCYITQDAFLVDYLTVMENLRLTCPDEGRIVQTAEKFEVSQNLRQYPRSLSGGERQRIALLRAFLEDKQVLLLDEPTSSLDGNNKEKIFETLDQMKQEKLIICACHDRDIIKHCDEVIDMRLMRGSAAAANIAAGNNTATAANTVADISTEADIDTEADTRTAAAANAAGGCQIETKNPKNRARRKNLRVLLRSAARQYRTNGKIELLMMFLIFLTVNMILAYCYDFSGKLQDSLENMYRVNVLTVGVDVEDNSRQFLDEIKDKFHIAEYIFEYAANAPRVDSDPDSTVDPNDFEDVHVLPYDRDAFPYSDRILYGNYFTEDDQIILGLDEATKICPDSQSLIGEKIPVKLYDDTYEFEVVGIFDRMDTDFVHYLKAADNFGGEDCGKYVDSRFASRYAWDGILGDSETDFGEAVYTLYFDSAEDMRSFRESAGDYADQMEIQHVRYFGEFTLGTASYSLYLYPVAYTMILGALFLFYMLKSVRMTYAQKNISVYQYYGYSYGSVLLAYTVYNLIELTLAYLCAAAAARGMVKGINILNETYRFSEFILFEADGRRMCYLYLIVAAFTVVSTAVAFIRLKAKGWYFLLSERRDLI